jgi:hypothetical protein
MATASDFDGNEVRRGDVVWVRAVVEEVHENDGFCDLTLRTALPPVPEIAGPAAFRFCVNEKQVEKEA